MVFAGFFVKLETMSSYTYWMSYGSYRRYALEAMLIEIYGIVRGRPRELSDCVANIESIPKFSSSTSLGLALILCETALRPDKNIFR